MIWLAYLISPWLSIGRKNVQLRCLSHDLVTPIDTSSRLTLLRYCRKMYHEGSSLLYARSKPTHYRGKERDISMSYLPGFVR